MKPETLNKNINASIKTFNIPKKEYVKLALYCPNLFLQKPETLDSNITKIAKNFNVEKSEIINLGKNYPFLFILNPETSIKKIKLSQYYKEIKGLKDDKLSFSTVGTDKFYERNILYLVKKSLKNNSITEKNYKDFIISNPNIAYEFELPKNELNEEFIEFTKNFFKKHTKKCNIKFIIR